MKRRMITTNIISEGKFLRMSLTAQALYMHLLANADDDGCVDAYTITRMIGAKEDDLVLLKEREYIVVLDEKEYILWITGWQDFNWIEPRYKEDSKYLPLLRAKITGLEIIESTKDQYNKNRYAARKDKLSVYTGSTPGVHSVHTVPTHADHGDTTGSTRLSIVKISKGEIPPSQDVAIAPSIEKNSIYSYWEEIIAPITTTQETQRRSSVTLLNKFGEESCMKMIRVVAHAHSNQYARKEVKVQSLGGLLANWDKVVIYAKSQVSSKPNLVSV